MIGHQTVRKTLLRVKQQGMSHTIHDIALKAINSVFLFKVLKGITVCRADPAFLKCPQGYSSMFLSERMLRQFAKDPDNEMSDSFLDEALSKGDECYAICDNGTLAAYGWYSIKPTRIDPPDLVLCFSERYVYMYKGLTRASYRGRRLHAIGISMALQSYLSRGFTGVVSYVESNNFNSLKSCSRIGFVNFGSAYVGKIFGRCFQASSPGWKIGFRVEHARFPPGATRHFSGRAKGSSSQPSKEQVCLTGAKMLPQQGAEQPS